MIQSNAFRMNCLPFLKTLPDNAFDIAIVDPPYGISQIAHRRNRTRTKLAKAKDYNNAVYFQKPPSQHYFNELFRVSKHQIIFGINYFAYSRTLPNKSGIIVWNKVNGNSNFSDCELAYCSLIDSTRMFNFMWNGMMQGKSITEGHIQQGNKKLNKERIHPCEKPIELYQWILKEFVQPGQSVLDTHMGSGNLRIACHKFGAHYTGVEISKRYFKDHQKRWQTYIDDCNRQPELPLFTPVQYGLF